MSGTAQVSVRFEVPVRSAAAVATAFLGDLIRAEVVSPSMAYLAVDPRKLSRA